jgi:hypothetical protein
MGQALLGARPGDTVSVLFPNGRERSLVVLSVMPPGARRGSSSAYGRGCRKV